jgi:hypothetical protein
MSQTYEFRNTNTRGQERITEMSFIESAFYPAPTPGPDRGSRLGSAPAGLQVLRLLVG